MTSPFAITSALTASARNDPTPNPAAANASSDIPFRKKPKTGHIIPEATPAGSLMFQSGKEPRQTSLGRVIPHTIKFHC